MQRPTTPKNEKPAVTIANLERENDNLAARIDELSKRAIGLELDRNQWRKLAEERKIRADVGDYTNSSLREQRDESQAKIAKLESVL